MTKKIQTNIYTLVATLFFGEILTLASPEHITLFIRKVSSLPLLGQIQHLPVFLSATAFICSIFLLLKICSSFVRIVRSHRWDIVATVASSATIVWLFEEQRYFETYKSYRQLLEAQMQNTYFVLPPLAAMVISGLILVCLSLYWKSISEWLNAKKIKSVASPEHQDLLSALSDDPWVRGKKDLLNYMPLAKSFSKKILEGSSDTSLVFGLEAPWGAGKTSFLQMCREEWEKEGMPLIINFNPWHFDTEADLVKKYFDQLLAVINKRFFSPELNRSISKYTSLISSLGIGWLNVKMPQSVEDVKKTHDEIGVLLGELDLKIVVIIDDLDRIHLDKARQILKLVALCADFPNIRYVLCYDLENLYAADAYTMVERTKGNINLPTTENSYRREEGSVPENLNLKTIQQIDNSPLQSYLEKIINTKYILPYYQRNRVLDYLVNTLYDAFFVYDEAKTYVPETVPISRQKLRDDLIGFFDEHPYIARRFVFSLRQVKSIVKTFLSAQENNPRLFIYDIGRIEHLILLIILKYHFPKVYADICYYEYNRDAGLFLGNPKYRFTTPHAFGNDKPVPGYRQYATDHGLDSTVVSILFLIFEKEGSRFPHTEATDNYHLNQYIKFIEGMDESSLTDSIFLEFFKNLATQTGTDVLSKFRSFAKKVGGHQDSTLENTIKESFVISEFFQKLMGKVYEINRIDDNITIQLIDEVISHYPKFSLYESENVPDTRDRIFYLTLKLLNDGVWNKKGAGHNTVENIKVIANYLLKHNDSLSVPEKIGKGRGPIGVYEMVHLRYSCNMSRGGSLWEINRALRWHKLTKNGILSNIQDSDINQTNDEETLEEITLHVFSIFKSEYIDAKRNFLGEIESLTAEQLLGTEVANNKEWLGQIKKEERFEERIGLEKAKLEMFTIYDLCYEGNYSGIKCGGYVYEERKIRDIMQDYLFGTCFTDSKNQDAAYEYFMNLLFRGFESFHSYDEDKRGYRFVFENIKSIIDGDRLLTFWATHRDSIKKLYEKKKGVLHAAGYTIFYQDDSKSPSDLNNKDKTGVFDILDAELEKNNAKTLMPADSPNQVGCEVD